MPRGSTIESDTVFGVTCQLPLLREEFGIATLTFHSDMRRRAALRRALPCPSSSVCSVCLCVRQCVLVCVRCEIITNTISCKLLDGFSSKKSRIKYAGDNTLRANDLQYSISRVELYGF